MNCKLWLLNCLICGEEILVISISIDGNLFDSKRLICDREFADKAKFVNCRSVDHSNQNNDLQFWIEAQEC